MVHAGHHHRRSARRQPARPRLCARVEQPQRLQPELQRSSGFRDDGDDQGAVRRALRRADLHARHRHLRRLVPEPSDRGELSGNLRRHSRPARLPGRRHGHRLHGRRRAVARPLFQPGAGILHTGAAASGLRLRPVREHRDAQQQWDVRAAARSARRLQARGALERPVRSRDQPERRARRHLRSHGERIR